MSTGNPSIIEIAPAAGRAFAIAALAGTLAFASNTMADTDREPEHIEIIGVTPLYGIGVARDKIPSNVQSATAEDLEQQHSLDLSDYLNRNFGSVTMNAAQNNPLQPDVQYRGFTASPLLGLPQGIAVYVDGVRSNESFGDTVNWDLLPESIINTVDLVGGSNPLFGLNALGGALSIQTKNGFTNPGLVAEASTGSFGRVVATAEAGGNSGELGYFINVQHLEEDGWRDDSPTDTSNVFGSFGWHTDDSSLDLGYFHANTDLTGNGPSPKQLLDMDRSAVFTTPDTTKNHLQMAILNGAQRIRGSVQLSGNAYYRDVHVDSFNGDGSPFVRCDDGAGNQGLVDESAFDDTNGNGSCDAGEFDSSKLLRDQHGNVIANQYDAVNNISDRDQHSFGGTLQVVFQGDVIARANQLVIGAAYDHGDVQYRSKGEVALLQADRSTSRSGLFVPDQASAIDAKTRTASAYFTDTLTVTSKLALTVSGRYNDSRIELENAGAFLDADADGIDDLDGKHDYSRFNPAVGVTYQITPRLNSYVGYSEASRTPTPVELACASPTAPCTLPNTFVADPPLKQVVAKTYEAGLRGQWFDNMQWNVGAFDTINSDDIIFQATGGITGNEGFFANVGDTRRSGVEVGAAGTWNALRWFANYSFVRAVFKDSFVSSSPAHPDATDLNGDGEARELQIRNGDRIPGIPENSLKFGADYQLTSRLSVGGDVVVNSGQYLRGDEANLLNQTNPFAVVNVRADYAFTDHVTLFATIQNLFDTDYETFGLLADPTEVDAFASFTDHRFLGPAPPFGGWVGVRVSL